MAEDNANDELVSQFMAVTGVGDAAQAASYLEMCGNNVETAVGMYMEHQNPTAAGGGGEDDIRAPDATRTMRLMDDSGGGGGMMMMMMNQDPTMRLMNAMMEEQLQNTAFSSPPAARASRGRVDRSAGLSVREAINAAEAAARGETKMQEDDDDEEEDDEDDDDDDVQVVAGPAALQPARLSDMFAAPTHLMHKAGGFQGARTVAKDSKRWLLVNIQRDEEFACHALNRDVWRDELVENLVREGFIFWQQMDITAEGRTYVERYQVQDYPHVAIIDPRTARLLWRKEGWTQEKPLTAEIFAEMAVDFCSRNSFDRPPQAPRPAGMGGAAAAAPRPNKRMLSEDEQMQAAMRASLGDDDEDDDDEIEYIASDDEDEQMEEEEDVKPAAAAPAAAPAEPSLVEQLASVTVPDEPPTGSRMQFRMPDGKRVVRKFDPTEVVRTVYGFLLSQLPSPPRDFCVLAGYPPQDLLESLDKTVAECGLAGQSITVRWKE